MASCIIKYGVYDSSKVFIDVDSRVKGQLLGSFLLGKIYSNETFLQYICFYDSPWGHKKVKAVIITTRPWEFIPKAMKENEASLRCLYEGEEGKLLRISTPWWGVYLLWKDKVRGYRILR